MVNADLESVVVVKAFLFEWYVTCRGMKCVTDNRKSYFSVSLTSTGWRTDF